MVRRKEEDRGLGGRDGCSSQFVRRRVESFLGVEPSSFDVESESALSAAGPRVRRETRAARTRGADGTQGKLVFLLFLSFWVHLGIVCVCCEALSVK